MHLTVVTTLQVHYDSTITRFGHQIAYGNGRNHSWSDVGGNISGITENAILSRSSPHKMYFKGTQQRESWAWPVW